jgi:hypothetical protein
MRQQHFLVSKNFKNVGKLLVRLLIDLTAVFILVRFIYYPIYKHRELFFTYFIFNIVIFLISFLLNKVDLSMGAAFGLFAVFSMLRYKTEEIAIKDMTYLFLVIALGLVSAVTKIKDTADHMELKELKPRKALNKAFLKVKPNRTEIEGFKTNLIPLLDRTNDTESEEFHKNLVIDFLKKTYYDPNHFINTKGRNDLVIHNGNNAKQFSWCNY